MASEQVTNTVRAGAFLLTTAAAALAVAFVLLRNDPFADRDHYYVRFTVSDGVAGLAPGSPVQIGGLQRGRVVKIVPDVQKETSDVDHILVAIELAKDIALYSNHDQPARGAQAIRVASPLGNTASINFVSVGEPISGPDGATNRIPPGDTVDAAPGSGLLPSFVGAENATKVGSILSDVAAFAKALDKEGAPLLADARTTVHSFAGDYEQWRLRISSSLKSADESLASVNTYLAPKGRVDVFLDDAVQVSGSAKGLLQDARTVSLPKVNSLLDEGLEAARHLDQILVDAQAILTAETPTLDSFLSEAREAATQLKLGTIEVRRNPWRLMNPPGPDVVANENLFSAASNFAMAVSDLRAASDSLEALVNDPRMAGASDAVLRDSVQKRVLNAMQRYQQAQDVLDEVLRGKAGPAGHGP